METLRDAVTDTQWGTKVARARVYETLAAGAILELFNKNGSHVVVHVTIKAHVLNCRHFVKFLRSFLLRFLFLLFSLSGGEALARHERSWGVALWCKRIEFFCGGFQTSLFLDFVVQKAHLRFETDAVTLHERAKVRFVNLVLLCLFHVKEWVVLSLNHVCCNVLVKNLFFLIYVCNIRGIPLNEELFSLDFTKFYYL